MHWGRLVPHHSVSMYSQISEVPCNKCVVWGTGIENDLIYGLSEASFNPFLEVLYWKTLQNLWRDLKHIKTYFLSNVCKIYWTNSWRNFRKMSKLLIFSNAYKNVRNPLMIFWKNTRRNFFKNIMHNRTCLWFFDFIDNLSGRYKLNFDFFLTFLFILHYFYPPSPSTSQSVMGQKTKGFEVNKKIRKDLQNIAVKNHFNCCWFMKIRHEFTRR